MGRKLAARVQSFSFRFFTTTIRVDYPKVTKVTKVTSPEVKNKRNFREFCLGKTSEEF